MFVALIALVTAVVTLAASPLAFAGARDRDGDGLRNRLERKRLHTNPRSRDTDRDRLGDGREVKKLKTNPRKKDTDGDGLRDGREVKKLKTNPRKKDTDGDGLRDGREVKKLKTNPRKKDTDGDGLSDGREVKKLKTNPRKKDTDGDGYSDRAELRAGTNPLDPASVPGRSLAPPPAAPTPSLARPACRSGAAAVGSGAALRAAVQSGQNACVTASIGNVDLSSLRPGAAVHIGTTGAGAIGQIMMRGASNLILQARFRSIEMRNSSSITIDNSIIGGSSGARVMDQLVFIPESSQDVTIRDSDIGWTSADNSGNTGYGLRVYGDSDRLRIERNYIHHIGGDGIQGMGTGSDVVVDRNEIAYVAPPESSDEHSDDIQIVGHGPNLRITNNYLHHNGWLSAGGERNGGSGPYIHAGDNDSLRFENNLVRDEENFMQVGNLGTGGTVKSNLTFRRNTFTNNGTLFGNAADLYWRLSGGSNNLYERNLVIAQFWNEFGFTAGTTVRDNLHGNYSLDGQGNCTSAACNPQGAEPIGYRKPAGVHW